MQKRTSGQVYLRGESIDCLRELDDVGIVFQHNDCLWAKRTVLEHLQIYGNLKLLDTLPARINSLASILNLTEFLDI